MNLLIIIFNDRHQREGKPSCLSKILIFVFLQLTTTYNTVLDFNAKKPTGFPATTTGFTATTTGFQATTTGFSVTKLGLLNFLKKLRCLMVKQQSFIN